MFLNCCKFDTFLKSLRSLFPFPSLSLKLASDILMDLHGVRSKHLKTYIVQTIQNNNCQQLYLRILLELVFFFAIPPYFFNRTLFRN